MKDSGLPPPGLSWKSGFTMICVAAVKSEPLVRTMTVSPVLISLTDAAEPLLLMVVELVIE